jgi:hypothetical protein
MHDQALCLLQKGKYEEALHELRRVWEALRMAIKTKMDDHPSAKEVHLNPTNSKSQPCLVAAVDDSLVSPHNMFGFFGFAFALVATDTFEELVDASHIVLFNMGFVCHTLGLLTGKMSCLHKALGLYHMLLRLIDRPSRHLNETAAEDASPAAGLESHLPPTDHTVLELALYSNLCHLHSHFCDVEESHRYRVILRSLLLAVPRKELTAHQYQLFFLNSSVGELPLAPPAA